MTVATAPGRNRMRTDDRRAAVFDEAIRIIGERGYRGFSINDLAKRCGLTTAGLLYHFPSKEDLLLALLAECDRRDLAVLTDQVGLRPGVPLSREQVLGVLRAIVANNVRQPDLVRLRAVLRVEALGDEHPARDYFRKRQNAVQMRLRALVAHHVDDPATTAQQIGAAMLGLEVQWLGADRACDLVASWDAIAVKLVERRPDRSATARRLDTGDHANDEVT